ncbi:MULTISPECIES: aminotransferase [Aneurinibacillus]|uniref:Aminotransferase class III-fold pyridoxal phosphate-dependent enzyme n=1 Tax=Aneurinibacillus thermoaerophilus TaxID=143495 RepID=A0A1G7YYN2_ANETH|nr:MULTISPECIES: aminotransferase [Aneurinibacillus]AMA73145.1 aminotransferase [Aneurinibacillus sp. XH2]MED0674437.1 aminotransferase [Aneurinibacillus thermoaerophilus]MED0678454.1 aminotransferase [Aneurinibacillus thermoaerophilus]MED0736022.1 aminotransferase [Aneurinibacillus thermoaerophilus]MED0756169.1 aminotransferase [Aneurinibacillus thermoaerophilus]
MQTELKTNKLIEQDKEHLWHAMSRYNEKASPMIATKGEGAWFTDINGDKYMDGVSGLWCLNLGHGRKEIVDAAYEQMMNLSYFPLTLSHIPAIQLSTKISELLQGSYTTFFSNSGSEANETAFKIARQYHTQNGNQGKYKFISRYRAYHGSTLGALSATAQANRRMKYDPAVPGFIHVPPPYSYRSLFGENAKNSDLLAADYIEQVINWEGADTVAGVILEPFISGGGVIIPSNEYLKRVAEICKKYDVLLIVDEVVSGFGRTGKMFGFMHSEGVQPDIVTMAKGLTSGYLPLGATAVSSKIYEKFKENGSNNHLRHISTYGGHPASCAVALKNIEIIENENIVERVSQLGKTILGELHDLIELDKVGEVRGVGFLYGIELVEDKVSKTPVSEEFMGAIIAACKNKGLIIGRNGDTVPGYNNVLIIAPPLSSTEEDLRFVVDTVKTVLYQLC